MPKDPFENWDAGPDASIQQKHSELADKLDDSETGLGFGESESVHKERVEAFKRHIRVLPPTERALRYGALKLLLERQASVSTKERKQRIQKLADWVAGTLGA